MVIIQEDYKGLRIEVVHDDLSESPLETWDTLGTWAGRKGRYAGFLQEEAGIERIEEIEADETLVSVPLYMYVHGNVTIRTSPFSCPWDSGRIGLVYCTLQKAREYLGDTDSAGDDELYKRAVDALESEVETMDRYLRGEVYGFRITDARSLDGGEEVLDSCYGFYETEEYVLAEAKRAADACLAQDTKNGRARALEGSQLVVYAAIPEGELDRPLFEETAVYSTVEECYEVAREAGTTPVELIVAVSQARRIDFEADPGGKNE